MQNKLKEIYKRTHQHPTAENHTCKNLLTTSRRALHCRWKGDVNDDRTLLRGQKTVELYLRSAERKEPSSRIFYLVKISFRNESKTKHYQMQENTENLSPTDPLQNNCQRITRSKGNVKPSEMKKEQENINICAYVQTSFSS